MAILLNIVGYTKTKPKNAYSNIVIPYYLTGTQKNMFLLKFRFNERPVVEKLKSFDILHKKWLSIKLQ